MLEYYYYIIVFSDLSQTDIAPQLVRAEETLPGVNSVEEINFSSPLNNSYSLGIPFLVEYDNTTSLKPIKNASPMSFDLIYHHFLFCFVLLKY
jgi:hypothetical protein